MPHDLHEERFWRPLQGLRFCFRFCRTRIVACGERPCGLPGCLLLAWKRLPHQPDRAQVYYIDARPSGDGYSWWLARKKLWPDERICCARRLTGLPKRKYQHHPSREQRAFAAKSVVEARTGWEVCRAEHQPTTRITTRLARVWEKFFGPRSSTREIVLASEVFFYEKNCRGKYEQQPVVWLSESPWTVSYLRWRWLFPVRLNEIEPLDLWRQHGLREKIVGYIPVDPALQASLARPVQRVLCLDYSSADRQEDWGRVALQSYDASVINPRSVWPGTVFQHFDGVMRDHAPPNAGNKRAFLEQIGEWGEPAPTPLPPSTTHNEPDVPPAVNAPLPSLPEIADEYIDGAFAFTVAGRVFYYDKSNPTSRSQALACAEEFAAEREQA